MSISPLSDAIEVQEGYELAHVHRATQRVIYKVGEHGSTDSGEFEAVYFGLVLDDNFEDILRPYLVHTLTTREELNMEQVAQLLESTWIESERRTELEGHKQEDDVPTQSALFVKQSRHHDRQRERIHEKNRSIGDKTCHHFRQPGYFIRECP